MDTGSPPDLDARSLLVERLAEDMVERGGRTLLIGEPGIGKSHLLDEVHRSVASRGAVILRSHGLDPDRSEPFLGLIDLLSSVDPSAMDRLPEIQRLALEVALARTTTTSVLPPMALRAGFGGLVDHLLLQAPLVVIVDDVDKLDPATSRLVHYVVTRPPTDGRRVGLVGTQQDNSRLSGTPPRTDKDLFGSSVVAVPGLTLEAFGSVLGVGGLPEADVASLHALTGGNPLWAKELTAGPTRALPGVPPSIAELLETRIDALSPELVAVFTTLAALGEPRPAELDELVEDGEALTAEGIASGLIVQVDGRLRPSHPLLAVAALDRLSPGETMDLHARIASWSNDIWERAYHLELSVPPGTDELVASALFSAGSEARRRGDMVSAIAVIEQSIARSDVFGEKHHTRVLNLAEYLFLNGQYARAVDLLGGFDSCSMDVVQLDRALPLLLDSILVAGSRAEALAALLGLRLPHSDDGPAAAVVAIYRAELTVGKVDERLLQTKASLETLVAADVAPVTRHRALKSIVERKVERAEGLDLDLLARSAEMEAHLDLLSLTDSAAAQIGFNAWRVDDLMSARRSLESQLAVAMARGENVSASFFSTHLAIVSVMQGRLREAARHLGTFDPTDQWVDDPVPIYVYAAGLLHIAAEDDVRLEAILGGNGPASEVNTHLVGPALRGIRAARHERWSEALPVLVAAHSRATADGVVEPGRRYWLDIELGEAQVASGDLAGAEETQAWLRQLSEEGPRPLLRGVSLRLEGMICAARGDLVAAEELLTDSIRGFDLSPFRVEAARSRLELGRLLRRTRRRASARSTLSAALAQVEGIGDRPLARRLGRELDLVPPSRSETTLTPTECRIAAAAASGMSNRQIATAHVIGVRTVETHLGAIYRKTGVRSRSGLSPWIDDHRPSVVED